MTPLVKYILTAFVVVASTASASCAEGGDGVKPKGHERVLAEVQDVVDHVDEHGFRSVSYVVAIKSESGELSRVVVADPLAASSYSIGDEIRVLIVRVETDGRKVATYSLLPSD